MTRKYWHILNAIWTVLPTTIIWTEGLSWKCNMTLGTHNQIHIYKITFGCWGRGLSPKTS